MDKACFLLKSRDSGEELVLWPFTLCFEGYHFCLLGVGLGLLICLVFMVSYVLCLAKCKKAGQAIANPHLMSHSSTQSGENIFDKTQNT